MKFKPFSVSIIVCATNTLSGCAGTDAAAVDKTFAVALRAVSDEGLAVEGVRFSDGSRSLCSTETNGTCATQVRGSDGHLLSITTLCPEGYESPVQPASLRLTEIRKVDQTGPAAIAFDAICTRKIRDVILVVRAERINSLPVEIAGKVVGQTDENGQAHLRLRLERTVRNLSVSLNTSGAPKLRPQNPTRIFELDGQDAVLLFDQGFAIETPAPVKRVAVVRKPRATSEVRHAPYRID